MYFTKERALRFTAIICICISLFCGGLAVLRALASDDPVDAQQPVISVQPQNLSPKNGDDATLRITASVADGGTLSYQWFSNTTESNTGGTLINGAVGDTCTVSTVALGTRYYYAVVTNTNTEVSGLQTATQASDAATVTVTAANNAKTPTITSAPVSQVTKVDDTITLSVAASVPDGGILSYQWYISIIEDNQDGAPVAGATSASFNVPTQDEGMYFYYVVVTNTNNNALVNKVQTITSDAVTVEVQPIIDAQVPTIVAQLTSKTATVGEPISLSIGARVTDGGSLSYQWFRSMTDSNEGGTLVSTTAYSVYSVPTEAVGAFYYYVVVINTNDNANNEKTASVTSKTATVTINAINTAQIPTIAVQPKNETAKVGDEVTLTVDAFVTDGGILSFQWYSKELKDSLNGTTIADATEARYTVPTTKVGVVYYYVLVTNTNELMATKTAKITSNTVSVYITKTEEIVASTPPEPSIEKITANSITIIGLPPDDTTGQIIEYGISQENNPTNIIEWQTDLTFSKLFSNTTYYIFARAQENDEYDAGPVSDAAVALTEPFYTLIEDIYLVIAAAALVIIVGFILLGVSAKRRKQDEAAERRKARSAILSAKAAATIYTAITPQQSQAPVYDYYSSYYESPPMNVPAHTYAPPPAPTAPAPRPPAPPARPAVVYVEPPSAPPIPDGTYKNTALLVRGVVSVTKKTLTSGTVIYEVEYADGRKNKGGEQLVKEFLHLLTL